MAVSVAGICNATVEPKTRFHVPMSPRVVSWHLARARAGDFVAALHHDDGGEGIEAFLARRPPRFNREAGER